MAVFSFTGDPRAPGTDPKTCEIHGVKFTFLTPTIVDDPALIAKLRGHSHFTEGEADEQPVAQGYRAIHNGGGRFVIVFGDKDEKVAKGLNKADAEAFNALSDEAKAAQLASFEAIE